MQNAGDARVFFAPFRGIGQGKRRLKPFPLMCRSQRYRFRWSGFCDAVQGGGRRTLARRVPGMPLCCLGNVSVRREDA